MVAGKNFAKMETNTESLLRELAEKLGTTTDKLWTILLVQSKMWGIRNCIQLSFFIIGLVVLALLIPHVTYTENHSDYISISNVCFLIVWVLNIVGWITSIFAIPDYISEIIEYFNNPGFSAFREITSLFNKEE